MAQALELTRQTPGGLATWLIGPTRTADIEKVLILGAQGPGELEVEVYEEGWASRRKRLAVTAGFSLRQNDS